MSEQRSRRAFLATAGTTVALGLAGCSAGGSTGGNGTGNTATGTTGDATTGTASEMTIFHAGSLAAPFEDVEKAFEGQTGIEVQREAKGSVASTKKVTAAPHRAADVLGVSDFRLIRDMVLPKWGDWYTVFATNAMTVAYTKDSKYADEFGPETWYDVLSRDDVAVAHSDPAVDPNGYRSVMAMELGAVQFQGKTLYDQSTAKAMKQNATVGAGTESTLISQLQSGKLDYAWEYQSAGASHDVQTVDLQPHVDLSKASAAYAEHYATAEVKAGGNTYTGAPIAYGMTVPSTAKHPDAGAKWIQFVATGPGKEIMIDNGFEPVTPPVVPEAHRSAVPKVVMDEATAKQSLGPLEL